ncbi:MAG: ABC transporter permease [Muribaculaceae bacterium]|nr:ABC transporter permease [Muribaculaceae bacterium]
MSVTLNTQLEDLMFSSQIPDLDLSTDDDNEAIVSIVSGGTTVFSATRIPYQRTIVVHDIRSVIEYYMRQGNHALRSFEIRGRHKEIGIRKVSGAKTGEIVGMLCRQYIPLLLCSFVLAAPLAWFFGNKTLQYFSQQTLIKWWIFPLALLVVGIIMLGAVAVQSWRTARENPVNSIKSE